MPDLAGVVAGWESALVVESMMKYVAKRALAIQWPDVWPRVWAYACGRDGEDHSKHRQNERLPLWCSPYYFS